MLLEIYPKPPNETVPSTTQIIINLNIPLLALDSMGKTLSVNFMLFSMIA